MGNGPLQSLTHIFRQHIRILYLGSIIAQRLHDRLHVADRYSFAQQIGKHLLKLSHRNHSGNRVLDNAGVCFFQCFQQIVDFLAV